MAKRINGSYNCAKDGFFDWNGYYFEQGENNFIYGKWENLKKNFINAEILENQILINIRCPNCGEIYTLYEDKKL